ncbi:polyprotein, partial [Euphorbia ringspot virus]
STVVDNTLMVILSVFYTLLKCGIEIENYENDFRFFANGDDLIIAINPEIEQILDKFKDHFEQLGLHYDFTSRTTDKSELWFMSHKAIKYNNMWIPKLEEARIVSILEWDRSSKPEHRLEAICAAMIEAWGYTWLVHEIRKFYQWTLEQMPYTQLAKEGKAPYIAETALKKLYTGIDTTKEEIEVYLRALEDNDDSIEINFVTGNKNKFAEVAAITNGTGIVLVQTPLNLTEVQGTRQEIIMCKAKLAFQKLQTPVLVEDTSLELIGCNRMPGPYVKFFSNETIIDMVTCSEKTAAQAICTFALYDGKTMEIVEGISNGDIVYEERGHNGFGWDCIFQDKQTGKTYAEMSPLEKNQVSHRAAALKRLQEVLRRKGETQTEVRHQSGDVKNAGVAPPSKDKGPATSEVARRDDREVNTGTPGLFQIPRLKKLNSQLYIPKVKGRAAINLDHLITYAPREEDISNVYATQVQFEAWYEGAMSSYGVTREQFDVMVNGFIVWCIDNGTSPNLNGEWVMMDGEEQVTFSLQPMIEHAKPTLRQVMAHYSNVAETYIVMRNAEKPYMPRYGLQRNLTDMSLARYAFDFYRVTSKTPPRAREAVFQMKAAALRNVKNNLFGLDGNVGSKEENTERHTADDVNRNMHSLLGMQAM